MVSNAGKGVRETHCDLCLPCRTSGEIFAQQMDISRLSEKLKDLIDIVSLMPHTPESQPQESACSIYLKTWKEAIPELYTDSGKHVDSFLNQVRHRACAPIGVCGCSPHLNRASACGPASSASQWQAHIRVVECPEGEHIPDTTLATW